MRSACTCPSGDGSLRWPCPDHPAPAKRKRGFVPPLAPPARRIVDGWQIGDRIRVAAVKRRNLALQCVALINADRAANGEI